MNLKSFAVAVVGCCLFAQAHADFSGAYDPDQWTVLNSNGGNGVAVAAPDSLQLTSSNFTIIDDAPLDPSTLSFSILVPQATTIAFKWAYATQDDNGSSNDTFGYSVSGQAVQLSADGTFVPQSGAVSVLVSAGSTFSFQMTSVDNIFGSAVANVTSFTAVSAVPEPRSLALALAALPVLRAAARRRRRVVLA